MAELLLGQTTSGVVVYDEHGIVRYVNDSVCELLGYSAGDILGQTGALFVTEEDREIGYETFLNFASRFGETITFQQRVVDSSGENLWVEVKLINHLKHPKIRGIVSYFGDISFQKKLEEDLQHLRRREEVSLMSSQLAHDYNNILAVMMGYLSVLKLRLTDAELQGYLEEISAAVERAGIITNRLLTFSRKQPFSLQGIEINALVSGQQVFWEQLLPGQVTVRPELAREGCMVYANPVQLEQVLLNLVVNARDAIKGEGEITVSVANKSLDDEMLARLQIDPSAAISGEFIRIRVGDTGEGIAEQELADIFIPFFTTKAPGKGTGLGLAIVLETVKQLRGAVDVHSTPGVGTTFEIFLPRYFGNPEQAEDGAKGSAQLSYGSGQILLVEDDQSLQKFLQNSLTALGYQVDIAGNFEQAMQVLEAGTSLINLLIIDSLPSDNNATLLIEEIRNKGLKTPVLHLSAYKTEESGTEAADACLQKPFGLKELSDAVYQLMVPRLHEDRF